MVQGKWRGKGGDVEVRECEPGLKGWEDHLGAGMGSVGEWRCQMGQCHEGPDVENDSGPLRASPRQPQPVCQTWGYVTTGEQGTVVGTGDSSMRGVAEAGDEKGRRKGGEERERERRGWGGASVQGQNVRRGKFQTEPLWPGCEPWVECNPLPGGRGRTVQRDWTSTVGEMLRGEGEEAGTASEGTEGPRENELRRGTTSEAYGSRSRTSG